jgi:adenylate kinase family enzyme
MQRISVVGNSGSGKTTAARELAALLDIPHVELDAIFHLPDWQELPTADFRDRVARIAQEPTWVIDGNYTAVRDLVWTRADTSSGASTLSARSSRGHGLSTSRIDVGTAMR